MGRDDAVVVFDGDGTVWDFTTAMRAALTEARAEIARRFGVDIARVMAVDDLAAVRDARAVDLPGATLADLRRAGFASALDLMGIDAAPHDIDAVTELYFECRHAQCRPFPDAGAALEELGRGFRLVLLTNGNGDVARMGLAHLFESVVYAEAIGLAKPDPGVYEHVAEQHPGSAFVSVGDSLANDVAGPQRAGWQAIWVNRTGAPDPERPRPDAVVTTLAEVPAALTALLAQS